MLLCTCIALYLVFSHVKPCLEIFSSLQHPSEKQKKRKEKAEGAQKKEKKAAPKKKNKKKIESEKSEEKFRSACILLSLCAELYCSLLELGPG